MADELLTDLERTRSEYEAECVQQRFLIDAYTGGGGFQGRVKQPAVGFWGAAAEAYSTSSALAAWSGSTANTYLDRHPREDEAKFRARQDVAHYPNYIEPIADLRNSYLLRKPFTHTDEPAKLAEWRKDVDGRGRGFDAIRPGVVLGASLCGWLPVLIDRPPIPPGLTAAQASEQGLDRVRVIPLTPANLLDWDVEDETITYAKVRTTHVRKAGWRSPAITVHRYTIWTATNAEIYEVVESDGKKTAAQIGQRTHPFGEVPIAICKHKAAPDDCVRGLPMLGQASIEARRLFNLHSEIDEHFRGQVFALLVLAKRGQDTGEVQVGVQNGLTIDPEAKMQHYFLAPPASVAEAYEKRIESTVREIYRMARVEFARASAVATSGIARAYEFAQTNRAIADFAGEVARWEHHISRLVGRAHGIDAKELAKHKITAPDSFDVEDLAGELKMALDAVTLSLGGTATKEMKLGLIQRLIPNIDTEKLAIIEGELDDEIEEAAQAAAAAREMLDAAAGAGPAVRVEGDEGEEDGGLDDEEPAPKNRRPNGRKNGAKPPRRGGGSGSAPGS